MAGLRGTVPPPMDQWPKYWKLEMNQPSFSHERLCGGPMAGWQSQRPSLVKSHISCRRVVWSWGCFGGWLLG